MSAEWNRIAWRRGDSAGALTTREWLLANGIGGYACGTLGGVDTRRFHGLLVASLPAPLGRMMIVSRVDAELAVGGARFALEGREAFGASPVLPEALAEVSFDGGMPTWRYEVAGGAAVIEKRVVVVHGRNTTCVAWRLVSASGPVTLVLRPAFHIRPHEGRLALDLTHYEVRASGAQWEVAAPEEGVPLVTVRVLGPSVRSALQAGLSEELNFRDEQCRGYDHVGKLVVPGTFEVVLAPGEEAALVATTEAGAEDAPADLDVGRLFTEERARRVALCAAAEPKARAGIGAELVLAADAFVIRPATRAQESTQAGGLGEVAYTIIAGYHWFTDWGRDTMISLEGLTLVTGRHHQAKTILQMFAHHVRDGLIPNMFPEGKNEGLYHTADATMWFFHAVDRYVAYTGDRATLRELLPVLLGIIDSHARGTRFGIHVDHTDGLLTQGAPGVQLTWMDAKVDGWVVTPRRGKAVEINALWFNALSLAARWVEEEGAPEERDAAAARPLVELRDRARASFNRRFWNAERGCLYDVVDGDPGDGTVRDDTAFRPNQVLAISLPNPVLDPAHWAAVLDAVRAKLLTPDGLRSLAPGEPDYKATYDGDLRARDAAYHQGTVWGWLAGPFVDACLRVHPEDIAGARAVVEAFAPHLGEACIGSISEIFDAEAPFTPRGCVAQAWSVAEVLRAFVRTRPG